jgi:mono/diheme cytochrome c family protein
MRLKPDGSELAVYASGLRNSVGMDWAPWSGKLFATDNGRDLLGDDFPPCELNQIEESGFYGWPYVNASTLDPDMGSLNPTAAALNIPPAHEFRAHNAPLGMRFLRHNSKPKYQRTALVALHGSWNRSIPDGYKVVSLHWQTDDSIIERDFLSGFLQGDKLLGRPVDIAEASDGSIFISDDYSGSVYRVTASEGGAKGLSSLVIPQRQEEPKASGLASYTAEQRRSYVEQGEDLYRSHTCSSCHSVGSQNDSESAISLVDLRGRYTVAELAVFFTAPTPPMPVFPLSAADREALAVYLLALP